LSRRPSMGGRGGKAADGCWNRAAAAGDAGKAGLARRRRRHQLQQQAPDELASAAPCSLPAASYASSLHMLSQVLAGLPLPWSLLQVRASSSTSPLVPDHLPRVMHLRNAMLARLLLALHAPRGRADDRRPDWPGRPSLSLTRSPSSSSSSSPTTSRSPSLPSFAASSPMSAPAVRTSKEGAV
jgi:hypothetical protein